MEHKRYEAREARRDREEANPSIQAMDKAQTQETDLPTTQLAALLEILEDVQAAHAYLRIRSEELRKVWVQRKLAAHGVDV